ILDVGCGTGVSTWLLAQQGYRAAGIDNNAAMLNAAQHPPEDLIEPGLLIEPLDFAEMDLRQLDSPIGEVDLVLAIGGVMNAVQSLRDLEQAFAQIARVVGVGKLFIFDMRTIRGLAHNVGDQDSVIFDNQDDLLVMVRSQFSYETLGSTRHYTIYQKHGIKWDRADEIHTERGYPTQAVTAMLQRTRFDVLATLDPALNPFHAQLDPYGRVVFVARRQ
ncbi:MAG: class I SAM-dependent methyltransferase, partial [Chloroflexi bacterium]